MKKFVLPLLSAVALVLGACQAWQTTTVSPNWFLGSNDFRDARPDMDLKISYAEMDSNKIRLYVHVIDTSNHFVQGIPPETFCELNVSQNGMKYHMDYRVTEYRQVDRGHAAFAFVLDHSGSMGNNKTRLYEATRGLIEKKREGDAYSIVRYADRVSLDVPLTADKEKLLTEFQPVPRTEVGSMTATWDGVVEGVQTLENSPYENRTLVVFTDGGENASKVTQSWAFWRAKRAGIKVVTVSLGLAGSLNMLNLCESTGGMYTQIDNMSDISNVYADLLNKQSSFYLIEFETPLQGRQAVQVNLCGNTSLFDTFTLNNNPAGAEPVRLKEDDPEENYPTAYGYRGSGSPGMIYRGGWGSTFGGTTRGGRGGSSSGYSGGSYGGSYGGGRGGDGGTSTGRGGSSSNGPSTGRGGSGGGGARP